MKKILLYGLDRIDANRFQEAAEQFDVAIYALGDAALNMSIESVFALQEDMDTQHREFPDSYMLFHEFELEELLGFLLSMETAGCPFEGIKVMRTELNEKWTLRALLKEAAIEQELSKKAMVVRSLLRSCDKIDLAHADENRRKEIRAVRKEAQQLLEGPSLRGKDVDGVIARLRGLLKDAQRILN